MFTKDQLQPGKTYRAVTLEGKEIKGQCDLVPGCALINSFSIDEKGTLDAAWQGETEMYWDAATPEEENGETLYQCEDGQFHRESDLRFVEEAG